MQAPRKPFQQNLQIPKAAVRSGMVSISPIASLSKFAGRKGLVLRPGSLPPRLMSGPNGGSGGGSGQDSSDDNSHGDFGTATIAEPKSKTKTPSLYRVIIMNDDYTPMDFVIHVIQKFFGKTTEEATEIMLAVHQKGAGVCGTYSYEIAETKTHQVNQYSRQNRHPLKCTMEKA